MKIQKLRAPLAALPLAVLAALPSHAQTDTYALLKETVVTATRVETRTDAVLSDVVVIEAEVLERSAGRSLSEVLSRNAGLQMSANGGLGKQSGLFVRGTETRHVLLLGLDEWLLLDRYKWPNNRALRFNWADILDRKDADTLKACAALLHQDSLAPGQGNSLLESLDENAHKHAFGVSEDLKHALREAIDRGFVCTTVGDATAASQAELQAPALAMIGVEGGIFGGVCSTAEAVAALNALPRANREAA